MRFLVDAQLPPALGEWLGANGQSAEHVADRQLEAASDTAIWECALRENAAIITKDEDCCAKRSTAQARLWFGSGCRRPGGGSFSRASRACCGTLGRGDLTADTSEERLEALIVAHTTPNTSTRSWPSCISTSAGSS
jgi:hypothetical protein